MDAPLATLTTRALMRRLWREHISHHRVQLLLVLLLTALMAGLSALYPYVIKRAVDMFEAHDRRILYQIPAIVVIVTSAKGMAQYGQTIVLQRLVLVVIRELQERMFAHLVQADLARLEREAPASLAARFTTDATTVREGDDPRHQRAGRCGHRLRPGRDDVHPGLAIQPGRRRAVPAWPPCRSSALASACAKPAAACRNAWAKPPRC